MRKDLVITSKVKNYNIKFIESLDYIIQLSKEKNVFVFIDKKVASLYKELNLENFVKIESVEENKTINGVNYIISEFIKYKVNMNSKIIVIGGGILQDLIGFCASVYCRGIDYILVPTTILSQVDSCVGGKTSINFQNKKNILGTFYPPSQILIYNKFIDTLEKIDKISGFGEIFKFYILQNKFNEFDFYSEYEKMLINSLNYKIKIISEDEFDKNKRKFLNFGHTFGHALETISEYKIPHGVGVILGSMIALKISKEIINSNLDITPMLNYGKMLLSQSELIFKEEWFDFEKLFDIIKTDKKSTGKLTMILMMEEPIIFDV